MAEHVGSVMLPNAPNWYCSKVADWSSQNLIAFGAKNTIYVLDRSTGQFTQLLSGHTDRVCAVEFSRSRPTLLYTAGADRSVRVWDVQRGVQIGSHTSSRVEVSALASSELLVDGVVSGDKSGKLVMWKHAVQDVSQHTPIAESITCLAMSAVSAAHVAVGYKSGLVALISPTTGQILFRLHGHSGDIQMLQFAKSSVYAPERLASSARDRTIRISDLNPDERGAISVVTLTLPNNGAGRLSDAQRDRLWLSFCWLSHDVIASTSHMGEMLFWQLSNAKEPIKRLQAHTRPVYNLVLSPDNTSLMSISMDRLLQITDVSSQQCLMRLSTLGGFAYSLSCSSLEPGKLLVGVGDNTLRLWSSGAQDLYDCAILWPRGVQTKITSVCWHPASEGVYALGTEDGLVGCFDCNTPKAGSFLISPAHVTVRQVSFRLLSASRIELWSCDAKGMVLVHPCNGTSLAAGTPIQTLAGSAKLDSATYSCFAWGRHCEVLALGVSDGRMCILNSELHLIGRLKCEHRGALTALSWSAHQSMPLLASSGEGGTIRVHRFGTEATNASQSDLTYANGVCIASFAHFTMVCALEWSLTEPDLLLSGSHDNTAQVWSVSKGAGVASLRGHIGRVLAVAWSTLTPSVIFSASEDQCVRMWDLRHAHPHSEPPSEKGSGAVRGNKRAAPSSESIALPTAATSTTSGVAPTTQAVLAIAQQRRQHKKEKQTPNAFVQSTPTVVLFPALRSELNARDDCLTAAAAGCLLTLFSSVDGASAALSSVFGSRETCVASLGAEAARLIEGSPLESCSLQLCRGNLTETLRLGLQSDPCNPIWTAIAASGPRLILACVGGREVWERTGLLQALTLESRGRINDAILLLLLTGNIKETIALYSRAGMWFEAIGVARARLPPSDPIIADLVGSYATALMRQEHPQQAARCLLSIGRNDECITLLASPSDVTSLTAALRVATSLAPTHLPALRLRLGAALQAADDWDACRLFYADHQMCAQIAIACTERTLVEHFARVGSLRAAGEEAEAGEFEEETRGMTNQEIAALPKLSPDIASIRTALIGSKFFQRLWALWYSCNLFCGTSSFELQVTALLSGLRADLSCCERRFNQMRGQVTWHLSRGILCLLVGDLEFFSAWRSLVQLMVNVNEWRDLASLAALFPIDFLRGVSSRTKTLPEFVCSLAALHTCAVYWHILPSPAGAAAVLQEAVAASRDDGMSPTDPDTLNRMLAAVRSRV